MSYLVHSVLSTEPEAKQDIHPQSVEDSVHSGAKHLRNEKDLPQHHQVGGNYTRAAPVWNDFPSCLVRHQEGTETIKCVELSSSAFVQYSTTPTSMQSPFAASRRLYEYSQG